MSPFNREDLISSIQNFLKSESLFLGDDVFFNNSQTHSTKPQEQESLNTVQTTWDHLKIKVQTCHQCSLCSTRKNTVFGEGHQNANLLFIGEAPGQREDLTGRPFVGRAGLLLDKMIEAMGLHRKNVFIANILKCRPPQNRNPLPHEITKCFPFLKQQINLLAPKVICTLGHFAIKTLLNDKRSMGLLRGKIFSFQDIPVIPTFHPAYLLRNPSMKTLSWKDLKIVMKILKTSSS